MKSFTTLKSLFTTLSLNSSSTNDSLAGILINDQHRYLVQKYFDTERSFTMTTIGPRASTLVATSGTTGVITGGTNATLSSAWSYISCPQFVVFSNSEQRTANFTQGSTLITWQSPLSSSAGTSASLVGVQSYPLPPNVSKIKNSTITIGQLVYSPAPVQSTQEWTKLNALPYTSSIPAYFFIYQNQINFWPIPAATGDLITLNCQVSIPDMTYEDYSTGSLATMAAYSNSITGTGTSWNTPFPTNTDLTFTNLFLIANPSKGDGFYYQIQQFGSNGTSATLTKPVVYAPNTSGANYKIGQYPLLSPDFHDIIVYGALRIYFMSINKDSERHALYNGLYAEKLQQMEYYLANKQVNVDLSESPIQQNPNLYIYGS
jgi:hypothetical protein